MFLSVSGTKKFLTYFLVICTGIYILEEMAQTETMREILDSVGPGSGEKDLNWNDEGGVVPAKPGGAKAKSCRWAPTSWELLEEAETRILSRLKRPYKGQAVNIGSVVGKKDNEIWTISMNEKANATPLVLLHGFGAGVGFWSLNLDSLSANRPVYAIDHLGFGRSSRPKFSTDHVQAEQQFVTAIEEWRKQMNLTEFVLLGHSFGGYIAMSYALSHPEKVRHLVLADPWGTVEKPKEIERKFPWWVKAIAFVARPFNPFAIIRAAGPMGQSLLERARPDLMNKFSELNEDGEDVKFGDYVYHSNAQTPSGEEAFKNMANDYGWAKSPMIHRVKDLSPKIPVTAIYGSTSWVQRIGLDEFQQLRPPGGYTNFEVLVGAGHHVYSDGKDAFNRIILNSCRMADGK